MSLGKVLIPPSGGGGVTRAIVSLKQGGSYTGYNQYFSVVYNGNIYSIGDTFTVSTGDTITIKISYEAMYFQNRIYVNGTCVQQDSRTYTSYKYTVTGSIDITYSYTIAGSYNCYLDAKITDSSAVFDYGYELTEGKVLIGGVAYSIARGRTLIDGVVYNIGKFPILVTITGAGLANDWCCCVIGGTTYTSAASGIEVSTGDSMEFAVRSGNTSSYASISINGTRVAGGLGGNIAYTYEWTVPSGTKNIAIKLNYINENNYRYGEIRVTAT